MGTERTTKYVLSVALCVGVLGSHVWASGSFLEDFSDGDIQDASPVTWRWDASMGECVVTPEGLQVTPTWPGPNPGAELYVFAQDAYGRDVHYTGNVTVRARVKVPESTEGFGSNAFVCLRTGDAAGGGYLLGINRLYFHIQRLDGYSPSDWYSPWQWDSKMNGRFDPAQDVMIQFDVIDLTDATGNRTTSRLEGRWWLPGQEMPAQPQVVATDAKFDAGGIAIGNVYLDGLNSGVSFRWVEVIGTQIEIVPIVDFNGDGTVDMKDLLKLIEAWGQNEPAVDIVPDGVVDKKDLEVLMDHWQQDVNDPTLLAHWAFDEAQGDLACDSTGLYDAALVGGPGWDPQGGQVDGALRLDGLNDCAVAPFVVNPAEGPFSVFARVKGGAPGQIVLSQIGGANWLMASTSDGALVTELKSTRGGSLSSQTVVTDGNWHRVGFSWDGSRRRLYVDDVLVVEDAQTGLAACYGGLQIGCGKNRTPGTFWSGLIDDVRIYNRAVKP
jgi:hypothetical protein